MRSLRNSRNGKPAQQKGAGVVDADQQCPDPLAVCGCRHFAAVEVACTTHELHVIIQKPKGLVDSTCRWQVESRGVESLALPLSGTVAAGRPWSLALPALTASWLLTKHTLAGHQPKHRTASRSLC